MGYLPRSRAANASWDAAVIGAGPAGVLTAHRLRRLGFRVLLIDAGPRLEHRQRVPEVDRRQWPFLCQGDSFDWYRVQAVGGRSLLWGGWSYRFPQSSLRRSGWPLTADDLAPWYREAERFMGVQEGVLDARYDRAARALEVSILPKRGACDPAGAMWTARRGHAARSARTYAMAVELHVDDRCVHTIEIVDLRTEKTHHVPAKAIVLAASPFETARLLFTSASHLVGPRAQFVDHMVAGLVLVEPAPPPRLEGRGRFPGAALVESFVNNGPSSQRPYKGGFSIELNGPIPLDVLGLERVVASSEVDQHRATTIYAIGELFPNPHRFVELDRDCRDVLGRLVPRIHVHWTEDERTLASDMRQACRRLADEVAIPGSRVIALADPLLAGAGHEAGTFPLGVEGDAPTDLWGKLRALRNVWVADASALPTAGDRHPTLTLAAHALRASESVAQWLRQQA
jgi:glucose dehydrogenase